MKKHLKSLLRPSALFFALSFLSLVGCSIPANSLLSSSSLPVSLSLSSGASSSLSSSGSSSSNASSSSSGVSSSGSSIATAEGLEVYALEQTGQYGDCTLFKKGNHEILIDGGNRASAPQLAEALKAHVNDHELDLLVLTHPHEDHYGGFTSGSTPASDGGTLVDGGITSLKAIVDCGALTSSSGYENSYVNGFRNYWIAHGALYQGIADVVAKDPYQAITFIDSSLQIQWLDTGNYLPVGGDANGDANVYSIACDVHFGSYDFFLAGDLPSSPERDLVSIYRDHSFLKEGNHLIYKACHHGSNGANDASLLSFLKPEVAWVSAGIIAANCTSSGIISPQHPFRDARSRIEQVTGRENMWWNGTAGTLTMNVSADSSSFSMAGAGRHYGDYYINGKLVDRLEEKDLPLELTKWASAGF